MLNYCQQWREKNVSASFPQPLIDEPSRAGVPPSLALNPHAAPFSPSSTPGLGEAGEELSDWVLFSPSSSEGGSSVARFGRNAFSSDSFADVVRGKGKAILDEGSSIAACQTNAQPPPPLLASWPMLVAASKPVIQVGGSVNRRRSAVDVVEPPKNKEFVSQDHIRGFSMK
jgi:hypothetical protein